MKQKLRYQRVFCWTRKHEDCDRLCPITSEFIFLKLQVKFEIFGTLTYAFLLNLTNILEMRKKKHVTCGTYKHYDCDTL